MHTLLTNSFPRCVFGNPLLFDIFKTHTNKAYLDLITPKAEKNKLPPLTPLCSWCLCIVFASFFSFSHVKTLNGCI